MEVIQTDVEHFKPKQYTLVEYLSQEEIPKKFLLMLMYIGIALSLLASFVVNNLNISLYLYVSAILAFSCGIALYLYDEPKDTKEAVIPNERNKNYLLCLGTEVKKFYGDAVKSGKALNNKIRPLLINAETMKRHFLCMATIGAGKSVLMKGLIEQYTLLGGGMMIVDGKGTDEFAKEIYGLVASLGREDDFVYLNF